MITLLVTPEEFEGEKLQVEGQRYRHLFRARRAALGDRVRLTDGAVRARWATVAAVARSVGHLVAEDPAPLNEPFLYLKLFCAMPKPERASWLVEKVTEIGVASVHFVASSRAPRAPGSGTMARLRRVAAAAVEQCHRSRVPEVSGVHAWSELEDLLDATAARYALDPRGGAFAAGALGAAGGSARVALLVGPEGGWSESEAATLVGLGCQRLRLGARMLRTETAAIVGAGLLLAGCD